MMFEFYVRKEGLSTTGRWFGPIQGGGLDVRRGSTVGLERGGGSACKSEPGRKIYHKKGKNSSPEGFFAHYCGVSMVIVTIHLILDASVDVPKELGII